MEKVTQMELLRLGINSAAITDGRVYFEADEYQLAQACIWLRSADRIFWLIDEFSALSFDELFDKIYEVEWEKILPENACINVSAKCVRSQIMSVPDTQRITKRAIIKALQRKYQVEQFSENGSIYPIELSLNKDKATIAIDCCGEGLHKRGYRTLNAEAPLRESFAAGLLLIAGYKEGIPFMDPFCGSGTLPIEAAMMALNIAPGVNRDFVCEKWMGFSNAIWKKVRKEAIELENRERNLDICGSDISKEMVEMSLFHAGQAGLKGKIRFIQKEVKNITSYRAGGIIVTNPPYGERLNDINYVKQLCIDMKESFNSLEQWDFYILSAYKDFERQFGKRANKVRRLFNANIECGFYQYFN